MKTQNKHRKIVLTGGPCCGKTTTINELRKRGHQVLDEIARVVIEEGNYHPSKGLIEFQQEILRRQLLQEQQASGITFLDRSALDGLAYSNFFIKETPSFYSNHDFKNRYDVVFTLDRFSLKNDGIRVEASDEEARGIHNMINQTYSAHGYNPIQVPIMPIEERVNFILNSIEGGK